MHGRVGARRWFWTSTSSAATAVELEVCVRRSTTEYIWTRRIGLVCSGELEQTISTGLFAFGGAEEVVALLEMFYLSRAVLRADGTAITTSYSHALMTVRR